MFIKFLASILLISFSVRAEFLETVGPNKGILYKNSKFATEIVYNVSTKKVNVFLLDDTFKNPTIENSVITFFHNVGKTMTEINCSQVQNFYLCDVSKIDMQKGILEIRATRNKIETKEYSTYPLPLK